MIELLSFLAICVVAAALFGIALQAIRPGWPRRRIAMISALPVPLVVLAMCIYIFVRAATASAKECGVDACGMAMMFAILGSGVAVAGFAMGLIACEFVQRARYRP